MWLIALVITLAAATADAQCCCTCSPTPAATPTAIPTQTATAVNTATIGPSFTPTTAANTWAARAGSYSSDLGTVVRVASDGSLFVAGFFTGTANFGGIVGDVASAGMDAFVAKYSATGFPLWVVHWGNPSSNSVLGLALDHQGNVIVAGQFQRTMNFGCGVLTSALQDTYDAFMAKLSPAGTCLWSQRFGSGGDDSASAVAVDGGDNIVLTGYFTGRVSFGGSALFSSNSSGGPSTFVAKYTPTGGYLWSRNFSPLQSNNGPDQAFGLAITATEDILVVGEFQGTEYFDSLNPVLSTGGSPDAYLVDLAVDGTFRWVRTFGSTGSDRAYAVTTDRIGNAVLTGYFAGSVDFGGKTLVATGPLNAFVVAYATNPPLGALVWARAITGPGVNFGMGLAVNAAGETLVTGQYQFTSNFDGAQLISFGQADVFVATYNAGGALTRARGFGSTLTDVGYSVAASPDGAAVATGYFRSTMFVGPTQLISAGQTDIYLTKLAP